MSRLTGNEVANMMEAYSAVYAPQQEEVVEEVEQINEAPPSPIFNVNTPQAKKDFEKARQQQMDKTFQAGGGAKSLLGGGGFVGTYKRGLERQGLRPQGGSGNNPPAGSGSGSGSGSGAPAGAKTAPAASSVVLAKKGGVEGKLDKATGKFTAGAFTGAEKERYVARGGSATPTPPKPAAPAQPKIKQDVADIKAMQTASQMRQAGANVTSDQLKTPPSTAVNTSQATAATTQPVKKEVVTTNKLAANPNTGTTEFKPGAVKKEEKDLFDVILGHLLEEGYAETEKAALTIMANMGEEWRESIVEAKYGTKAGRKALAKKIRKGENIGKKGPGTGFKAVEKAAKEGGAKDPAGVAAAQMWKTYGK
jgi:hypothetical protein